MTIDTESLKSPPTLAGSAAHSSPLRQMFVLLQVQPTLAVLATSNVIGTLECERDALLAKPWDQGEDGVRELRIGTAHHLSERSRERRRYQRQNRFR